MRRRRLQVTRQNQIPHPRDRPPSAAPNAAFRLANPSVSPVANDISAAAIASTNPTGCTHSRSPALRLLNVPHTSAYRTSIRTATIRTRVFAYSRARFDRFGASPIIPGEALRHPPARCPLRAEHRVGEAVHPSEVGVPGVLNAVLLTPHPDLLHHPP